MSSKVNQYLKEWMELPTQEVLARFEGLAGAIVTGKGLERSVYIPGKREDRVLLVAHSDTVFDNRDNIKVVVDGERLVSAKKNIGIGADDRAGCAILWYLKDSGHSLFIPNGEESGCIGSRHAMKHIADELQNHQFAIEFDRRGDKDLVFYNVGTNKFAKYLETELKDYKFSIGAWTDICVICRDICGVNISVGYYGQHSSGEYLITNEWINTARIVKQFLEQEGIPKFPLSAGPAEIVSDFKYGPEDFTKFKNPEKPKTTCSKFPNPNNQKTQQVALSELPLYAGQQSATHPNNSDWEEVAACEMIAETMMEEIYVCTDCMGISMRNESQKTGLCPFCGIQTNV